MRNVYFFDKLAFRMPTRVSAKVHRFLKNNAHRAYRRKGHPMRSSDKSELLVVVAPNARALAYIATRRSWMINCVEVARDTITDCGCDALLLHDLYDASFVQARHGKRETTSKGWSTRTDAGKGPGVQFAWYSDGPSKWTKDRHRFHLEGRYQGVRAVVRLGIREPRDLVRFDHRRYWRRNDVLYVVDYERLGRFHQNRRAGSRRRTPRIHISGSHRYNVDRSLGCTLYRAYAVTTAFAKFCDHVERSDPDYEELPEVRIIDRDMQKFIDTYGRGPYLRRVVSPIVDV